MSVVTYSSKMNINDLMAACKDSGETIRLIHNKDCERFKSMANGKVVESKDSYEVVEYKTKNLMLIMTGVDTPKLTVL